MRVKRYRVIVPLRFEGQLYHPDETIKLSQAGAKYLLMNGHVGELAMQTEQKIKPQAKRKSLTAKKNVKVK